MNASTRLLGISNAIVDVLTHVDDAFLDRIGAPPGSMTLIDEARAHLGVCQLFGLFLHLFVGRFEQWEGTLILVRI